MALVKVFEAIFNTQAEVAKWYYSPVSLAGGVGNLRLATDGADSFIEIEFGRTAPSHTYQSKAAMLADLTPGNGETAYCFDVVAANHGAYAKVGASGAGGWSARLGDIADRAYDDPNHTRVAWLELLLESWSAAGDPGAPGTKMGWPDEHDLRGGEIRYLMRARDLRLGEHAKIVQHIQTQIPSLNLWPDDAVQQAWVNVMQIADPISDQLGFGTGGYYAPNPVEGVHDSGWVEVRIPLREVASDWLALGGVEGRQGLTGDEVRYYNYVVAPPSVFLSEWTGNAYMVAAHKVVDAETKATPPGDDLKIEGRLLIKSASLWLPA